MKRSDIGNLAAVLSAGTVLAVLATICSNVPVPADAADSAETIPADADHLFAYLQAGKYKAFAAQESDRHPSAGPHTKVGNDVRVFMNAALAQSLESAAEQHPAGAGVVKEMFNQEGKVRGWAVAIKTQADSQDGEGWYWYEVKSTTDNSRPVAAANGVKLCTGCHVLGQDFVLSAFPLN